MPLIGIKQHFYLCPEPFPTPRTSYFSCVRQLAALFSLPFLQANRGKPHRSRRGENRRRTRPHADAGRRRRAHALPDARSGHDVRRWLLPGHQGGAGWGHHHDQWVGWWHWPGRTEAPSAFSARWMNLSSPSIYRVEWKPNYSLKQADFSL